LNELGPVFRAEKSHTTRHVTEFTGLDFEQGFIVDHHDVMDTAEGLLVYILKQVKIHCQDLLKTLGKQDRIKVPTEIPRIEMKEAKDWLSKKGIKLAANEDLTPEAEKALAEIVSKKLDSDFVFVTNYPWEKRPFYHMRSEHDKAGTKSFDLIWRGVEISTGAQREHRYDVLKAQAKEKGIKLDEMKDYANIFQYGCPPHGGAGLGLDRIIEQMLELDNIREVILLPRDPERLTP
jgi:nondiscriminating aspartyl-tRNA synthetase